MIHDLPGNTRFSQLNTNDFEVEFELWTKHNQLYVFAKYFEFTSPTPSAAISNQIFNSFKYIFAFLGIMHKTSKREVCASNLGKGKFCMKYNLK